MKKKDRPTGTVVVMDHSSRNPTRFATVNGRFMLRSFNSSFSLSQHHILNRSLGPLRSLPPPHHSSLPGASHPSLHQPPLLPLPGSKSTSALSPPKRTATTIRSNQQKHRWKGKSSAKPRNGKAVLVTAHKCKAETWEEEREDAMESIYSISPPPSSLPLPRFSLRRPKSAASCAMEAVEGGSIDIGATDGLRRLLRL